MAEPNGAPVDAGANPRLRGAVEKAHVQLTRMLDLREVLPGDRLPPATTLAETLQVSRVSVLQALQVLQSEGRVVVRPGRAGARVEPPELSRDARLTRLRSNIKKPAEILAFYEVTVVGTAGYAARHGIDNVPTLLEVIDALQDVTDPDRRLQLDNQFHIGIAAGTGVGTVKAMVQAMRQIVSAVYDILPIDADRPKAWVAQYRRLVTAITAGDSKAASEISARHTTELMHALYAILPTPPDGEPGETIESAPVRQRAPRTRSQS